MSLHSMTGHGRGHASQQGITAEVEISAVNRRQLDLSVILSPTLSVLVPRIEEEVRRVLSRGRVSVVVAVDLSPALRRRGLRVDADLALAALRALRQTARRLGLREEFPAEILLRLPEVVHFEHPDQDAERVWPVVRQALGVALRHLVRMRRREGVALQRDLEGRLRAVRGMIASIKRQAPRVVERYRRRLIRRLKEAGFDEHSRDERMIRELTLFADRADISEELTRLESHLDQTGHLLCAQGPSGRSLDFLAQEMFREANTIGSKANDAQIAREVVGIKAELERLREQVQNIE